MPWDRDVSYTGLVSHSPVTIEIVSLENTPLMEFNFVGKAVTCLSPVNTWAGPPSNIKPTFLISRSVLISSVYILGHYDTESEVSTSLDWNLQLKSSVNQYSRRLL